MINSNNAAKLSNVAEYWNKARCTLDNKISNM